MTDAPFRSGFVALIGRPNSGKSTLLNTILGEELSPVTPLPQTTRRRFKGIYSRENLQIVFVDTPGVHKGSHRINETMLQEADHAAFDEDLSCLCYLADLSREFGEEEKLVASIVQKAKCPVLIVFTKKDICADTEGKIADFSQRFPGFSGRPNIVINGKDPADGKRFLGAIDPFITEGPQYFDDESLTDSSMRAIAAEFIRKQIILATQEEVPHAAFVEIESYRELKNGHKISAVIHVETIGQKGIIIGRKGAVIEKIRRGAEAALRRLAGCPVAISCHIVVTPHWRDDLRFLQSAFQP